MISTLSIRSLSITITSICIAIIGVLSAYLIHVSNVQIDTLYLVSSLLIGWLGLYLIIKAILHKYVFEKLRVIYKFIDTAKRKKNFKNDEELQAISIDDVSADVQTWAKETKERIKSLQSMEEYRKNFVGNVSHELKTPIFSLQGYLHTLLDGGMYDENIHVKYLRKAAQNADRLQHIVEDLESIGQLESGKMDLEIERFDIYELIKDVIQEQKRQAEQKNIQISLNTEINLPLYIMADKEAIRQVLSNLVTNSIKYGEEKGVTTISVFDVNKSVLVEVDDDGLGIEEKHLQHLFDRFYRVDKSRSRLQGGSGLGLSIAKHLIEAHNQKIMVRSTVGEGSTFGFTVAKSDD